MGAPDILVTVLSMADAGIPVVSKGNCGVPQFVGTEIVYSGTPDLMARYAALAIDAGASIIGGCCGTSPEHLASMRGAIDAHTKGDAPSIEQIVEAVGPLTNSAPTANSGERRSRRSRGE